MANQVFVLRFVSFLILFLALLWRLGWLFLQPFLPQAGKRRTLVHRLLKPRTPLDCPGCRLASPEVKPASAPVRPWREVKSRRGAPSAYPLPASLVPTRSALTSASQTLPSMRWWEMASMARPSASRPFVVRLAASRSVLGATRLCTV